jgi:hypothetical protein
MLLTSSSADRGDGAWPFGGDENAVGGEHRFRDRVGDQGYLRFPALALYFGHAPLPGLVVFPAQINPLDKYCLAIFPAIE